MLNSSTVHRVNSLIVISSPQHFEGNEEIRKAIETLRGTMVRTHGNLKIITGTIIGGIIGFYVMHRVEISYKEKMKQRLIEYQNQLMQKEKLEEFEDHP